MHLGHLTLLTPVIYLVAAAIVVLLVGVAASKNPQGKLEHYLSAHYFAPALTFPALILAGWIVGQSLVMANSTRSVDIGGTSTLVSALGLFVTAGGHPQVVIDPFAAIFTFLAIAGTLIVMLISIEHFGEHQPHKAEYYSLLMFCAAAAALTASASDLIVIYLSVEFLSMISYVLAAYAKNDRRSGEAGLKYFMYGAACSATMLYGMSILFGISGGSTSLTAIAQHFTMDSGVGPAASAAGWVAVVFTLAGLGFKIALVPFQFWAPDTYEGAPTPITAFLSVVSKAAGIAVLSRFVLIAALPAAAGTLTWYWLVVLLSILSMFYGNLAAIPQVNIKRMLAYSSIAQVGYIMVGVLAAMHQFDRVGIGNLASTSPLRTDVASGAMPWDMQGVIVYVIAYLFTNLGAFSVITVIGKQLGSNDIKAYAGLMRRAPFYAISLVIFLLSLAGIPPTAGFLGKFLVFGAAIKSGVAGHWELAVLAVAGVVNSVISVVYYMNVVRLMFFSGQEDKPVIIASSAARWAIVLCLVGTLALILLIRPVAEVASAAVYNALP